MKKDDLKFSYTINGDAKATQTPKSIDQKVMDVESEPQGQVTVTNTSTTVQFAKVILSGKRPPEVNQEPNQKTYIARCKIYRHER